jgi:hypothetical protein
MERFKLAWKYFMLAWHSSNELYTVDMYMRWTQEAKRIDTDMRMDKVTVTFYLEGWK